MRHKKTKEELLQEVKELHARLATQEATLQRQILESIQDAFFALDDNWRFVYLNSEAYKLLQREPGSLIGKNVWEEFPEAVEYVFYEHYHHAMKTGEKVDFTAHYQPLEAWFDVRVYPAENRLSVYFTNVTARVEAQQELHRLEQFRRGVLDSLSANICILDPEGSIISVNQSWVDYSQSNGQIPGYRYEGVNYLEVCERADGEAAETGQRMAEGLRDVLSGKRDTFSMVYPCPTPTHPGWFKAVVTPLQINGDRLAVVAHENITERKLAEIAQRESEARYRLLAANATDMLSRHDLKGVFLDVTPSCERLLGYTPDELVGKTSYELFHPDDLESVSHSHQTILEQETIYAVEYRIRHKEGHYVWVETTSHVLSGELGDQYIIAVTRDISQRKTIQQELSHYRDHLEELVEEQTKSLLEANMQLRQLSAVKDEFVANVSHELRSPITSIKLRLHLLERDPSTLGKYLPNLMRETQRLTQTIENLLNISQLDQSRIDLDFQAVDLAALAEGYVADRQMAARESRQTLVLEEEGEAPPVKADPALIGQVLSILLSNAMTYTPPEGTICVSTTVKRIDGKTYAGLYVKDTGLGIPPEEQKHLFERFYRGASAKKGAKKGTGLGLAIAQEIVNLHCGHIDVESEGVPGKGARFSVWLPVV